MNVILICIILIVLFVIGAIVFLKGLRDYEDSLINTGGIIVIICFVVFSFVIDNYNSSELSVNPEQVQSEELERSEITENLIDNTTSDETNPIITNPQIVIENILTSIEELSSQYNNNNLKVILNETTQSFEIVYSNEKSIFVLKDNLGSYIEFTKTKFYILEESLNNLGISYSWEVTAQNNSINN